MNKEIIKILIFSFCGILIFLFGFFYFVFATSPYVYVSPTSLEKTTGELFIVSVGVNTQNNKVCAVEGKLNLNNLSCQSVKLEEGIMPQSSPSCNNLYFLLGIPGCTMSDKTLFTITVKGRNSGSATINFERVDIIGEGVSISSASVGGSYNIIPSCSCSNWSPWQSGECGAGNCSSNQRLQTRTRTCTPSRCNIESENRCINDPTCISTIKPETPSIEGEATTIPSEAKTERKIVFIEEIQPQKENLLASLIAIWGGTSQFVIIVTVTILFLAVLLFIIIKEWKLYYKKS